jgi:hypothetical protein
MCIYLAYINLINMSEDRSQRRIAFLVCVKCRYLSLMIKAVRTSETSIDNYFTRHYIPEDNSEHHTRRRENLKTHKVLNIVQNYVVADRFKIFIKDHRT